MTAEELVAFAEDLARIAAGGGGPQALAEHLATRTGGAVLVEGAESKRIAAVGRNTHGQARTVPIASGASQLGELRVFSGGGAELEHVMRLTASAIALELAREAAGEPGRRRAFWERLITRAHSDAAAARDDAAARGIVAASHYIAVALESEQIEERAALRTAALAAFRSGDADGGFLERGTALLFFIPAAREIDAANARTAASLLPRTIAKKHPQPHVNGGVGTRVPLADLQQSLQQAQAALSIARRLHGAGRIGVYDDLGAYPLLLSGADAPALRAFSQRTLAPLRAYDEKHQTELERTLRLYFSVGENVKTAAAELNVHRHTVFYRLRQIGEISGCKLDDPHDQLTLRMAIAIDALTT